jgi:hypothetical protein
MRTRKLFHVLVVTGGTLGSALGSTACADDGTPEPGVPVTKQQASKSTAADDSDAGADKTPAPAPTHTSGGGSGSHFW